MKRWGLIAQDKAGKGRAKQVPSALKSLVVFALPMFYFLPLTYTALPNRDFLVNGYFLDLINFLLL